MHADNLLQVIENPDYGTIAYIFSDTLDDTRFYGHYEEVLYEKDIAEVCTLDYGFKGIIKVFKPEDGYIIIDEVLKRCSDEYPSDVYVWRRKNGVFIYRDGKSFIW